MGTVGGKDEIGMAVDVALQPLDVIAEPEVPVLLLELNDFTPLRAENAIRAAFLVREKLLLTHAVEAGVALLVELAAVMELLQHGLNHALVPRVRGGGPAVVADVELVPERREMPGDSIDKHLGTESGFLGTLLHFLSVLVHAGEEKNLTPVQPLKPRHDISQHFFISVPDVRRRVGVINGGGDVVRFHGRIERGWTCSRIVRGGQLRRRRHAKMKRRLGNEPAGGATRLIFSLIIYGCSKRLAYGSMPSCVRRMRTGGRRKRGRRRRYGS